MWSTNRAALHVDSDKADNNDWRAYRRAEPGSVENRVWRIAATLMPGLILNSLFGNTFTLYSVAPFGWLLIGWISAEQLRKVAPVAPSLAQESNAASLGEEREQFAIRV